jgi:hypothetical protein
VGAPGGRTWWAHFEFTRINIDAVVEIDRGVASPKQFLDFLSAHELAPAFNQHSQKLERLFPKNHLALAFSPKGV